MSERKPAGMPFETWVERQIREAQERGEFDDLPGAGKPLADLTGHYDELWWVKRAVAREGVSCLPPALALRKEAEQIREELGEMPSEEAVRRRVRDYHDRLREYVRRPQDGPHVSVRRLDADELADEWRRRRAARRTD